MVTDAPQPRDVYIDARGIEPLAKPIYPTAARGRQTSLEMIGLRIVVDTHGNVSDIGWSLRAFSTAGPWAAEFRAAAEAAVRQWHFIPAEIRHLEPAIENGVPANYFLTTSAEKTEATFDIAFTFSPSGDVMPVKR